MKKYLTILFMVAFFLGTLFTGEDLSATSKVTKDVIVMKDGRANKKNIWVEKLKIKTISYSTTKKPSDLGTGRLSSMPRADVKSFDYITWGETDGRLKLRAATTAWKAGKGGDCVKNAEEAIEFLGEKPAPLQVANFLAGEGNRMLGEYQKAVDYYAKLEDDDYYYSLAMMGAGQCHLASGNYEAANEAFGKAGNDPNHPELKLECAFWKAKALAKAGKFKDAANEFSNCALDAGKSKVVKAKAESGKMQAWLGAKDAKKAKSALTDVESVSMTINKKDRSTEAMTVRAVTHNAKGWYKLRGKDDPSLAAIEFLTTATLYKKDKSEYANALYGAALCYREMLETAPDQASREKLTAAISRLKNEILRNVPGSSEASEMKNW